MMEHKEDQVIRLESCHNCSQHHQYQIHSELQYQQNYEKFTRQAGFIGLKVIRNLPPRYLTKAPALRGGGQVKKYIDTNNGKTVDFPSRGAFEVYFKKILIFSKIQSGTFPDIPYLCSLIEIVNQMSQNDVSMLDSLERCRALEYERKRNTNYIQSLYYYVKINACGNTSKSCTTLILQKLVTKGLENSQLSQKKTIHPYLIYESTEKKTKIQQIYCPNNLNIQSHKKPTQTTNRSYVEPNSTLFEKCSKKEDERQIKQQTFKSSISQNAWTQRAAGSIIKNLKRKRIFQLVINEQNKAFDQAKIRKWAKDQSLFLMSDEQASKSHKKMKTIAPSPQYRKYKGKEQSFQPKSQTPKLWSLTQSKSLKRSKDCPAKSKITVSKLHVPVITYRNNKVKKQKQQIYFSSFEQKIQPTVNNITEQILNITPLPPSLNLQIKTSEKIKDQNKMQREILQIMPQIDLFEKIVVTEPKKLQKEDQLQNNVCENHNKTQDLCIQTPNQKQDNCFLKVQKTQQSDEQSNISESRAKRISIEELTVKKRIFQRKRSSNHQRHPLTCLLSQRLNSFRKDSDYCKDSIISDRDKPELSMYQRDWKLYKQSFSYSREPAQIVRKFSEEKNFLCFETNQQQYEYIIKNSKSSKVEFKITGEQLVCKLEIKKIRNLCKPTEVRLFPEIFKQIEPKQENQVDSQDEQILDHEQTRHKLIFGLKLMQVVNMMLRSNPMMIIRLFEDKKSLNPYGVYCIWLKNWKTGRLQQIFINDQFAFQQIQSASQAQRTRFSSKVRFLNNGQFRSIYYGLSHENSIWYMLLQKAVAKLIGGYHLIEDLTLAQLIVILTAAPTVDIGCINPQKAMKVFDSKVFYNKMTNFYSIKQGRSQNQQNQQKSYIMGVDRIVDFSFNKRDPRQSAIKIKTQQKIQVTLMRDFLVNYGQICLTFFNNTYFFNQKQLSYQRGDKSIVISCKFVSTHNKNNCYLLFSTFPQKYPTKVTLYRQLTDKQAGVTQGMNPLSQQNFKYEYAGEICKTQNFFFQVQLTGGNYVCIMQNTFDCEPFLSFYSEYPVLTGETKYSELSQKPQQKKKVHKKRKICTTKKYIEGEKQNETPKILIERRIEKQKISKGKSQLLNLDIKLKKLYANQLDNVIDSAEEDEPAKRNQRLNKLFEE